jgi:hypothetical protein
MGYQPGTRAPDRQGAGGRHAPDRDCARFGRDGRRRGGSEPAGSRQDWVLGVVSYVHILTCTTIDTVREELLILVVRGAHRTLGVGGSNGGSGGNPDGVLDPDPSRVLSSRVRVSGRTLSESYVPDERA